MPLVAQRRLCIPKSAMLPTATSAAVIDCGELANTTDDTAIFASFEQTNIPMDVIVDPMGCINDTSLAIDDSSIQENWIAIGYAVSAAFETATRYHRGCGFGPQTIVQFPQTRRYRLLMRPCTFNFWQYAVTSTSLCENPIIIPLAANPRRAPFDTAPDIGRALGLLRTGDQIFVPGETIGAYDVELDADRKMDRVFRRDKSVFRGYSPVRRIGDQVARQPATNSGLRNFTSHPSTSASIFPH